MTSSIRIRIRRGRRAALAVALGSVLALTATACGDDGSGSAGEKGEEGSGKGTITFWDNNGGVRTDVWKQIIADFENSHPDIKVKYVGVPAASVQSKYDTAIQGGGLPDVGGVGTAMLAEVAAQGALEPLDDRISGSPLNGKLNTKFLESVKAAGGDGRTYTVPTSANNGTLWYRTDLFGAAKLDPPTTWTKFYKAADKLTDKGKNAFGYTIRGGEGSIAQALDAMYGQSGITSFWNGDRTTVNDPKNVAALEKYVGLYKKDTPSADVNNDFTKMVAQWDSGTIGMLSHNLGSYTDHEKALKGKFRGIPNPTLDDGTRVQVSNPVDGLRAVQVQQEQGRRLEVHRVRRLARVQQQVEPGRGAGAGEHRGRAGRMGAGVRADQARRRGAGRIQHEDRAVAVLPSGLEHHLQGRQRAELPEGTARKAEREGIPGPDGRPAEPGARGLEEEPLTARVVASGGGCGSVVAGRAVPASLDGSSCAKALFVSLTRRQVSSAALAAVPLVRKSRRESRTLYIAGDSTAAQKYADAAPGTGWGMALPFFLRKAVRSPTTR